MSNTKPVRSARHISSVVFAITTALANCNSAEAFILSTARHSVYHISFADTSGFSDAVAAYDVIQDHRIDAAGDFSPTTTFAVRSGYYNYSHTATSALSILDEVFNSGTSQFSFSLLATNSGPASQFFHYDSNLGSSFAESWVTSGTANGLKTLEFSGGGFANGGLADHYFDLDVFLEGDWSHPGTSTGAFELLGLNPDWTIVKNFQYDPVSGQTEFFATNANFVVGANPNFSFRVYGAVVPEPSTFALLGVAAIILAVIAVSRRGHDALSPPN